MVNGELITGTMPNSGDVVLTSTQTGLTTIDGYVSTINASNVYSTGYTAGYNAKTCPTCSKSFMVIGKSDNRCEVRLTDYTFLGWCTSSEWCTYTI